MTPLASGVAAAGAVRGTFKSPASNKFALARSAPGGYNEVD